MRQGSLLDNCEKGNEGLNIEEKSVLYLTNKSWLIEDNKNGILKFALSDFVDDTPTFDENVSKQYMR